MYVAINRKNRPLLLFLNVYYILTPWVFIPPISLSEYVVKVYQAIASVKIE